MKFERVRAWCLTRYTVHSRTATGFTQFTALLNCSERPMYTGTIDSDTWNMTVELRGRLSQLTLYVS